MNTEQKELILDYLHQRIEESELTKLHALLDESAEARAFLRIQSAIDVQLHELAISEKNLTLSPTKPAWGKSKVAIISIATLAACVAIFLMLQKNHEPQQQATEPPSSDAADGPVGIMPDTSPAIAILKNANRVQWLDNSIRPTTGSTLTAGWLRFSTGTLQIEFFSGARLLLEGPAAVRLDTENSAFMESGKAAAHVPEPAHGFVLQSPTMHIKDLGTSFGLEVSKDKNPEIHVFDGSVELSTHNSGEKARLLPASTALELKGDDLLEIPMRRANFPSTEELSRRSNDDNILRNNQWTSTVAKLATDPSALVVFHFNGEAEWRRTVTNRVTTAPPETHAAIVGAGWTSGRWKGKQGLEFRTLGDRLRFSVPGTHEQLTTMAWIRVDGLTNSYNALLLPTHYTEGSIHWTIERGGEMRLTQLNNSAAPVHAYNWNGPVSGTGFSALDMGRWMFIATTYNASNGHVIHYRDGNIVGEGTFTKALPVTIGEVEFGNWGADGRSPDTAWIIHQKPHQKQRNFVGRLDHLSILSRALSKAEIQSLYQQGHP